MTTIALKGNILAADTKLILGDDVYIQCNKLHIIKGIGCFGIAGDTNDEWWFLRWIRHGMRVQDFPADRKFKDFEALLLDTIGHGYFFPGNGPTYMPVKPAPFFAIGTGSKLAFAGMATGLSAVDAVKLAGSLDNNTNQIVDYYNAKTQKITRGK
jgi:hypothetical protein